MKTCLHRCGLCSGLCSEECSDRWQGGELCLHSGLRKASRQPAVQPSVQRPLALPTARAPHSAASSRRNFAQEPCAAGGIGGIEGDSRFDFRKGSFSACDTARLLTKRIQLTRWGHGRLPVAPHRKHCPTPDAPEKGYAGGKCACDRVRSALVALNGARTAAQPLRKTRNFSGAGQTAPTKTVCSRPEEVLEP